VRSFGVGGLREFWEEQILRTVLKGLKGDCKRKKKPTHKKGTSKSEDQKEFSDKQPRTKKGLDHYPEKKGKKSKVRRESS